MELLDGRLVRDKIITDIKDKVNKLDRKPCLAVISVGNNDGNDIYINTKKKMCDKVGYDFKLYKYDNSDTGTLCNLINDLNNDDKVDAILVQLPLPNNIDKYKVLNSIDKYKDVDGLCQYNRDLLLESGVEELVPCTALGIIKLLEYYNIEIGNKNVVILGKSDIVGKPLERLFLNRGAKVVICDSKTKDISVYTKNADILVVAIGKKEYVTDNLVNNNCIIIDVGIHYDNGKIVGDVDFDNVRNKASYITPVPGGVGPMTIAMLCYNVYKCYLKRNGSE